MAGNPMLTEALSALNNVDSPDTEPIQYADVIVKTCGMFVIAVIAAVVGWAVLPESILLLLALTFGALGLVLVAVFRKKPLGPGLPLGYAVLEGGAVGMISEMFAVSYGSDIVVTAVLATAVTFAACLGVFTIPKVRNSTQGTRFFLVAIIAYLGLSVISIISGVFFGVGDGLGFYGLGWLGIAIAVGATLLSAWSLVIDFGQVDRAVKNKYPEHYSWNLSLGLFISTVWLYLNILRLLGLARR